MTAAIWKEFHEQLLAFIRSRVDNSATAEDILQEVFIKIHQKHATVREEKKLTSWIYQITRNAIIDHYRKQRNGQQIAELDETLPDIKEEVPEDLTACLKPFIQQLPEHYRDILEKTTYGNLSQKAYALQNNLSYPAVKSRVQRARQAMQQLFNECCMVEADKYGNILSAEKGNCNNC